MTTYTATFHTPTAYAEKDIEAKTPKQALKKAQALHREDWDAFNWYPYDTEFEPLDEIEIVGPDGEAIWQSDDLVLRFAAADMLEALELCEQVLAELSRLDDGTPSVSALHLARTAIAKAKGGAA